MQTVISARWIAWLKATGTRDPLGHDYMSWINAKWRKFEQLNGIDQRTPKSPADHEKFDAWLYGEVPKR